MATVKLNLNGKSDSELLTFTQQHILAMDGNANFPSPNPDAATLQALYDEYETALDEANVAQDTAREKTGIKDEKRGALEVGLSDRGRDVQTTSGGNQPKISSASFEVRGAPTPVGPMPAPVDFLATMGDMEGEIDLVWSAVYGAMSYVIQKSDYAMPRVWTQVTIVTKSKATVPACDPGEKYVFRVAAVGAAGQGPWSDESVKMAP